MAVDYEAAKHALRSMRSTYRDQRGQKRTDEQKEESTEIVGPSDTKDDEKREG